MLFTPPLIAQASRDSAFPSPIIDQLEQTGPSQIQAILL